MPPAGLQQTWPGTSHHLPSYSPKKDEQVLQKRGTDKKNTAQRSHPSRQEQQRARLLAGGHQLGKDALGDAGLAYVPRLPLETRRAAAPGSSPPPPRCPTPTGWSPGPQREPLRVRATGLRLARPLQSSLRAPSAPPAGCSARQAGQGRAACCRARGGESRGQSLPPCERPL